MRPAGPEQPRRWREPAGPDGGAPRAQDTHLPTSRAPRTARPAGDAPERRARPPAKLACPALGAPGPACAGLPARAMGR